MRQNFKETKEFVRDSNTNAILRVGSSDIKKYKSQKEELLRQKNEINRLKEDVESLRILVSKLVNRTE